MNYTQQEVDQAIEYLAISASNNIPQDDDEFDLDVKVWQLIYDLLDTVESYYTVADMDADPIGIFPVLEAEAESWLRCGWRHPGDELTFEMYVDTVHFLKEVEQRMADTLGKYQEDVAAVLQRMDEKAAIVSAQGWDQLELPFETPPEQPLVSSFVQLKEPALQEEDPEAASDDPIAVFV